MSQIPLGITGNPPNSLGSLRGEASQGYRAPPTCSTRQRSARALLFDAGYTVLVLMSRCKNFILQRLKGRQKEVELPGWEAP